ncbi:MAG TPA: CSLREA domain-containing protein [Thermoanaerobaculia bacterium]|nr:CSLREA domain-containing protein [Thermoanaerobaculia bacterium]
MIRTVRLGLLGLCFLALPVQGATFFVTKTADTLDGACDRDCSLREAIAAADAEPEPPGDADVVVVPAGIYVLTRTGAGEEENVTGDLDVYGGTILVGAGAGSTVIDGAGSDRVLDLRGAAEIDGVTIRNGRADGDGGGVLVRPGVVPRSVLVQRSVVSGNRAQGDGGGIAAPELGDVEIRESAILENQAGGDGGGISGIGFRLENVTVSDNRAEGSGGGLAYEVGHGETISSSTIVFNQAGVSGGGIRAHRPLPPAAFPPQVQGSIVSENFAPFDRDCSTTNPISLGYNVFGAQEGCFPLPTDRSGTDAHPLAAVFRVQDTRLGPTPVHALLLDSPASNLVPSQHCADADQLGQERFEIACDAGALEQSLFPDCLPGGSVLCLGGLRVTATLDERFPSRGAQAVPLTGDTGMFWFFAPDNLEIMVKVLNGCALNGHLWVFASGMTDVGIHLQAVDPKTGRTRTYDHAAGTTFPPRLDTDAFPCPDPPGLGVGDNSFFKLRSGEVFRVTRSSDGHDDGSCDHDCSLREAMTAANARPTTSAIVLGPGFFALNIPGGNEDLGQIGDLDVTRPLVILGAGADRTTIDGGGLDRVLDVRSGGSLELYDVTVSGGRAITDTSGPGSGGGIRSSSSLLLVRSAVRSNRADFGGGIASGGVLAVRDSTVSGNVADASGGGILAEMADLENVTLSGNQAGTIGGGLLWNDAATLRNVTIAGNTALAGGGIATPHCQLLCEPIPFEMQRTLIAGNVGLAAGAGPFADCDVPAHTGDLNVFGVGNGCSGGPNDRWGTPAQPLDARLTPLGDHGGPTPTHALLPDSPAIDLAPAASCPQGDQRGRPRPADGDGDGAARCDAGAVERQPGCQPNAETLCLGEEDRFRITARWTVGSGSGPARVLPLAAHTGSFWFFHPANLELTVKVLDGCGLNDRFWVFLSGLTDVGVEVTVEDTATGNTWTHDHAAGTPLQPRLDTNALNCVNL